jgi:hypothetical protein
MLDMKLQDILQPKIQKNNANFLLPSFKPAEHYHVLSEYEARIKVQILSEFIPSSPLIKHLPIEGKLPACCRAINRIFLVHPVSGSGLTQI